MLAARAFDRAGVSDSARASYEVAATELPLVADWLRLRAAGVTADSAARAADYAAVRLPEARSRIRWTEALARQRFEPHVLLVPRDTVPSAADDLASATILLRLHRDDAAERLLAELARGGVPHTTPAIAHMAQYARARALLGMGETPTAQRTLRGLVRAAPRDTAVARALLLLADLAADAGDDRAARSYLTSAAQRFPTNRLGIAAQFQLALLLDVDGSYRAAAMMWDATARRHPESAEATAARYWSGRAWHDAGHPSLARARWRMVILRDPLSYYATLSAHRLGAPTALPPLNSDSLVAPLPPALDSTIVRAAMLGALGMGVESQFEIRYAIHAAGSAREPALAVGAACIDLNATSEAVAIARRLLEAPGPAGDSARRDPRVYRLLYPLRYADTLRDVARAQGLDPALVAAVVRQESTFNPQAVSIAGARGLMQIMPAVGRALARSHGLGSGDAWDASILDQPASNLALGAAQLATFLGMEAGDVPRALAAYNAGPSRVAEWVLRSGATDDEVFIERIPYAETRDYVRAILQGQEAYAAVYGATLGSGS